MVTTIENNYKGERKNMFLQLYTEQELEFYTRACNLLGVSYTAEVSTEGITHYHVNIMCDSEQERLLKMLGSYNYKKNFA